MEQTEKPARTWLVISTPYAKYIGSVTDKEAVLGNANWICLEDAFDFTCQLQAEPGPGSSISFGKMTVASRVDMLLSPTPLHVNLAGAAVYFFDDMSATDRTQYENMLKTAREGAQQSLARRREQQSGISLATRIPEGRLGRSS